MSETHRRRGTLVSGTLPWTPKEDHLARTLPAEEAVRRTGRTLHSVYVPRSKLQLPTTAKVGAPFAWPVGDELRNGFLARLLTGFQQRRQALEVEPEDKAGNG